MCRYEELFTWYVPYLAIFIISYTRPVDVTVLNFLLQTKAAKGKKQNPEECKQQWAVV